MKPNNFTSRNIRNSNNSSGITAENSSILLKSKLFQKLPNGIASPRYLNASIFESKTFSTSREKTPKRIKSDLYLTDTGEIKEREITNLNENLSTVDDIDLRKKKMRQIFDFRTDKNGKILPSIRRKPPTLIYCCDERFDRENLSKLYMKYFVSPPKKKIIINHKSERVKVKESSDEYIEKTKNIVLARYTLKIKQEAAKRIEDNIKKEIKTLDKTMKKIKCYQTDLENNFMNKYNDALKQLSSQSEQERIKNDELNFKLNRVLKDVNSLNNQIAKKESIKNSIEKWIIFQIQMDKRIIPVNIKEFLKKEYNNQLIFQTVEDFKEWFVREEDKNLKLLSDFQRKYKEKEKIEEEFLEYKKYDIYNIEIDKEVQEKENLLNLLKIRNAALEKEKIETSNYVNKSYYKKKRTFSFGDKPKIIKDNIYLKIKYIYHHLKEKLPSSLYDFELNDHEIAHANIREVKILKMLNTLEQIINILLTKYHEYKSNNKYTAILKEIHATIDLEHKKETARRNKLEEERKIDELQERINQRNNKVIYIPLRKVDNYPFALFIKPKTKKGEKNEKKDLSLSDFLYDNK